MKKKIIFTVLLGALICLCIYGMIFNLKLLPNIVNGVKEGTISNNRSHIAKLILQYIIFVLTFLLNATIHSFIIYKLWVNKKARKKTDG